MENTKVTKNTMMDEMRPNAFFGEMSPKMDNKNMEIMDLIKDQITKLEEDLFIADANFSRLYHLEKYGTATFEAGQKRIILEGQIKAIKMLEKEIAKLLSQTATAS